MTDRSNQLPQQKSSQLRLRGMETGQNEGKFSALCNSMGRKLGCEYLLSSKKRKMPSQVQLGDQREHSGDSAASVSKGGAAMSVGQDNGAA